MWGLGQSTKVAQGSPLDRCYSEPAELLTVTSAELYGKTFHVSKTYYALSGLYLFGNILFKGQRPLCRKATTALSPERAK